MAEDRSPLPWAFEKKSYGEYIVDRKGGCVAGMVSVTGSVGDEINKANAAFLIRAANSHDDLVAALRLLLDASHNAKPNAAGVRQLQSAYDAAYAALAQVEAM